MAKIWRAHILVFIALCLLLTPVTAAVGPLGINVDFPSFYEVNISGAKGKLIGVAGVHYPVTFNVSPTSKELDLNNRYLNVSFTYNGPFYGQSVFCYKDYFEEKNMLNDTFSLSNLSKDQLNGNCGVFKIAFYESGTYVVQWNEIVGDNELKPGNAVRISIVEPYEYEALLKQSQLLEAEKMSAAASENAAKYSKWMAVITGVLAFFTALLAWNASSTSKQIQRDREIDLLRKRLENLYSMLRFNRQVFERYNPSPRADGLSQEESDFYRKVRANLYLGSNDLVPKAKKLLDLIDGGGYIGGKRVDDDELKKIKKDLIDQVDSDYEKYMGTLIELTKPRRWWDPRVWIRGYH
jgi:hypothetical protein